MRGLPLPTRPQDTTFRLKIFIFFECTNNKVCVLCCHSIRITQTPTDSNVEWHGSISTYITQQSSLGKEDDFDVLLWEFFISFIIFDNVKRYQFRFRQKNCVKQFKKADNKSSFRRHWSLWLCGSLYGKESLLQCIKEFFTLD